MKRDSGNCRTIKVEIVLILKSLAINFLYGDQF